MFLKTCLFAWWGQRGLVCQIAGLVIKDCRWFVAELSLECPCQVVPQELQLG